MEIKLKLETCEECPKHKTSKVYTADSWDDVRKVYCEELCEDVHNYLDWRDKSIVPNKCPLRA